MNLNAKIDALYKAASGEAELLDALKTARDLLRLRKLETGHDRLVAKYAYQTRIEVETLVSLLESRIEPVAPGPATERDCGHNHVQGGSCKR